MFRQVLGPGQNSTKIQGIRPQGTHFYTDDSRDGHNADLFRLQRHKTFETGR